MEPSRTKLEKIDDLLEKAQYVDPQDNDTLLDLIVDLLTILSDQRKQKRAQS